MDNASEYKCANSQQRRDAADVLREFQPRMRWGPGEAVLDLGCGPGDVTCDVLVRSLPPHLLDRVIGLDVSASMVRYASEKYADDRLSFQQLDISSADDRFVPLMKASKLFSFYCLHWLQSQRSAVRNIYGLLGPGGEALLVFLARSPVFDLYEEMAANPKWQPFMTDVSRFVSPYQHCADPAATFGSLLESAGFDVLHCSCREMTFDYGSIKTLKESVKAVNPFLDRVPEGQRDAFVEDCMAVVDKLGLIMDNNNGTDRVNTSYSLLVAHAMKPM